MRVDMTPKEYQAYVKRMQKKSPLGKDMALAFVIGGLICVAGQAIGDGFRGAGLNTEDAGTATSVSLVFLSALLLRQYMHNTEIAVTMRLSTILKTIKQPL